jgi:chaperonin GroEL
VLPTAIVGANKQAIGEGIRQALEVAEKTLVSLTKPFVEADLVRLATSLTGSDTDARILAEAFAKVGIDGVITVEPSNSMEMSLDIVEGMRFDRGYLSAYFVTDPERMEAVLENPVILIYEKKISSMKDLLPMLEQVARLGRPLLIIAEDIDGEALATLVVNKIRGTLQSCAVKAPGFGDRRKAMLEDIAILTGGRAITEDLGVRLENIKVDDCGKARRVRIDKDSTMIVEGAGSVTTIQSRVVQIRAQIDGTTSEYDREKMQERLAKLVGGVAVVRVGAATESEIALKRSRLEDAVHTLRAAFQGGVVPGAGTALVRAVPALRDLRVGGEQQIGVSAMRRALEAPLRQLAESCGEDPLEVVRRVLAADDPNMGFDVERRDVVDLRQAGVIDPVNVVRAALVNAAYGSINALATEAMISLPPKEATAEKTPSEESDSQAATSKEPQPQPAPSRPDPPRR